MATHQAITGLRVGEDWRIVFSPVAGAAEIDVTEWELVFTMGTTDGDDDVLTRSVEDDGIVLTSAEHGLGYVSILRETTLTIAPGSYFYELRRTDAGHNKVLSYGPITVSSAVRQISLTSTPQRTEDRGYRVAIAAVGVGMASEVFVMKRRPINPTRPGGSVVDTFNRIAATDELTDLPVGAPLSGAFDFRTAAFAQVFPTRDLAEALLAELATEINALIQALNAEDQTRDPETVVIAG